MGLVNTVAVKKQNPNKTNYEYNYFVDHKQYFPALIAVKKS